MRYSEVKVFIEKEKILQVPVVVFEEHNFELDLTEEDRNGERFVGVVGLPEDIEELQYSDNAILRALAGAYLDGDYEAA